MENRKLSSENLELRVQLDQANVDLPRLKVQYAPRAGGVTYPFGAFPLPVGTSASRLLGSLGPSRRSEGDVRRSKEGQDGGGEKAGTYTRGTWRSGGRSRHFRFISYLQELTPGLP